MGLDEDPNNYYALRVCPFPNTEANADTILVSLNKILGETFVVCKEFSKKSKYHNHAVFHSPDYNRDEFKERLYTLLKDVIPDWDTSKKGNTVFTCTQVRNLERSVMYVCKDKRIEVGGDEDWRQFVEEKKNQSFGKPLSIKELMDDLYSRFENDELNDRSLWIHMVYERAQFPDQKTKYADIDAYIETFKVRKFGLDYVREVWETRNLRT